MLTLLKPLILLLSVAMMLILFRIAATGRKAASSRVSSYRSRSRVRRHREMTNWLFFATCALVAAVLALEFAAKESEPFAVVTPLFITHIIADVLYLGAFAAMRLKLTGMDYQKIHGRLAYLVLMPSFAVMTVTGILLLAAL